MDVSFTGMNQDTAANLYDFPAREYGTQGRWPSPDPAGLSAADPTDPQTWNRYAYVGNNPQTYTDPSGLVRDFPTGPGMYFGANGSGFGCQEDGLDMSCESAYLALQAGGAVQCPNNNCGIGTATPYQCLDTACGYMSYQYAGTHENEQNGVLYSNSEWALFISNRVEAQRQALTDAIVAATGLAWESVYENLVYDRTQGGNANFSYSGNLIDLSFIPEYSTGGCEFVCRSGSFPSIHEHGLDANDDPILHLDTGNPMWGFGLGFLVHFGVDMLLGNINPSVPLGP